MKTFKLTSLFILSLTLAACSGGGGSGTAKTPDGDKVNLTLSPKGYIEFKSSEGLLRGVNQDSSFYGAWLNDNRTLKSLHYQGSKTTNVPTSGTATYKGESVYVSGYDSSIKKGGISTLNVDFGNKTVAGDISFSVLNGDEFRRDITLHKSNLVGAQFAGQASVLGNSGGTYKGALFGDGATEAAGSVHFENNNSLDVSFGGKKQ